MPGKYFRGAFVEFTSAFLVPIPNVIVFQFNPETLTHTWTPAAPVSSPAASAQGQAEGNPLAISGDPGEEFSFTLSMDSSDTIADGSPPAAALAQLSGIYPRLASLELLLFPSTGGGGNALTSAAGSISVGAGGVSVGGALGGAASGSPPRSVPPSVVPTVLFVWGPGRVLPVRVTSLRITEKLYDGTLLVPTHAEADIGLRVLTQREINAMDSGLVKSIVQTAYDYMGKLRQGLAVANLVNSADSIIGMLPF
jgi:hypothetical protein